MAPNLSRMPRPRTARVKVIAFAGRSGRDLQSRNPGESKRRRTGAAARQPKRSPHASP